MQRTSGLRALLSHPVVYEAFQRAVGSVRVRRMLIDRYLRPRPGEAVLDIGCGPGDLLAYLPGVEYTGFDLSEAYIESARRRFGDRGRFFVGDVAAVAPDTLGTFDLVVAKGVLHHLDDAAARRLVGIAARVLRPGGRFVTVDPCFSPRQSRAARALVARDRGGAVRTPDAYRALADERFSRVDVDEHHDLLRMPYSHAVLVCTEPRDAGAGG